MIRSGWSLDLCNKAPRFFERRCYNRNFEPHVMNTSSDGVEQISLPIKPKDTSVECHGQTCEVHHLVARGAEGRYCFGLHGQYCPTPAETPIESSAQSRRNGVKLTWSLEIDNIFSGSCSKIIPCRRPTQKGTDTIGRHLFEYRRTSPIICLYVKTL